MVVVSDKELAASIQEQLKINEQRFREADIRYKCKATIYAAKQELNQEKKQLLEQLEKLVGPAENTSDNVVSTPGSPESDGGIGGWGDGKKEPVLT
jgi:hypothetical protein